MSFGRYSSRSCSLLRLAMQCLCMHDVDYKLYSVYTLCTGKCYTRGIPKFHGRQIHPQAAHDTLELTQSARNRDELQRSKKEKEKVIKAYEAALSDVGQFGVGLFFFWCALL